ncbi:MAG: hypothetical protein GY699_07625 [Desulfobacteraceae bacterium]|nr:hypothetical protein [Desulfobacteraceae bacterium]
MRKRTKILIVLSVAAVISFTVYKYMGYDKKESISQTDAINLSSTDKFVEDQIKIMEKFGQHDADEMIIKKAVVNWSDDPFASPELMKQIKGKVEKQKPTRIANTEKQDLLLYSGYVQVGEKMLAIINGMEYEKGDMVEGTYYKVFSASTESIMLRSPDLVVTTIHLADELGPIARGED